LGPSDSKGKEYLVNRTEKGYRMNENKRILSEQKRERLPASGKKRTGNFRRGKEAPFSQTH
jgi:hypothetical protein